MDYNHHLKAAATVQSATGDDLSFGPRHGDTVDVTLTFSNIIFALVPSCLFVAASLVHLRWYYRRPNLAVRSAIFWAKVATAAGILGLSVASSVAWCTSPASIRTIPTMIPTSVMFSIAGAALAILVWVEHYKARQPSFVLSFYLSIAMLLDAARARSFSMRSGMESASALTGAVAALKFVLVVLLEIPARQTPELQSQCLTGELTCGFWNRSVIAWINPLLLIGFRRNLLMSDLKSLDETYSTQYLDHRFTEIWDKEPKTKRALAKAFMRMFGADLLLACLPQMGLVAFDFSNVYIMQAILTYLAAPEANESFTPGGLLAATAFSYAGFMITKNTRVMISNRVAVQSRSVLFAQITKKIMRLPLSAADKSTALTHISADAMGISDAMNNVPGAFVGPLNLGVALYVLYGTVGKVACLIVAPCFLYIVSNGLMTYYIPRSQKQWNGGIDARVKCSTSVMSQLRAIKIVGLATSVGRHLQSLREAEVQVSTFRRWCSVFNWSYAPFQLYGSPVCILAGVMFWTGQQASLDAEVIYPIFSFTFLVVDSFTDNRQSWPLIASMFACFSRVQDFLLQDERDDTRIFNKDSSSRGRLAEKPHSEQVVLSASDISVVGKDDGSHNVLSSVNLNVERTSLTMLVGPVGSGKSVFLKTLLGETLLASGTVHINVGSVAYCGQSPWIPRGTIRDAITGEAPFEETWYNTVVKACALDHDFTRLADNDQSSTGTNGSTLSGGQIRRVGLARAVYSKAELLLCDDVLSALDKTTSAHIFESLFGSAGLLRKQGRTTVLATHSIEWLDQASQIFLFQAGTAKICNRSDITTSIEQMILAHETGEDDDDVSKTEQSADKAEAEAWETPKMTTDWGIYRFLLGSVPWYILVPSIVGLLLVGFMERCPDLYIRIWLAVDPANQRYFIGMVVLMIMDFVVIAGALYIYFLHTTRITSTAIHRLFVDKVMSATLPFITSTNNGALLNKFTQDMTLIAQKLPSEMTNTIYCFELVFQHTVMIAAGAQYAALMIPIVIVVIYYLQLFYLQSSRQMRLLDLESQTPIYTKLIESTAGLDHIRAFGWETKILEKVFADTDDAAKPFHYMYAIQRWLMLVLNGLALAMSVVLVAMAVYFPKTTSPAGLGIALISIINYGATVEAMVVYWTGLETSLGAVRRIKAFVEDTPTETDKPGAAIAAPCWPSRGRVVLKDVSCAYSTEKDASLALQNVNLTVEPGQKAIVVGRTGSGKSTLLLTLLNCLHYTGSVSIDGTDITDITHDSLRGALTTISQEAISLPGTVKENLTSTVGESTSDAVNDQEVWSVLELVRLKDHIAKHGGLEAELSEVHFSSGQRQLLIVARAILHQRRTGGKLILVDEATSNMDYETDGIIQGVLDTVFADCTRIIVSHRQVSAAHYDVVVSMENGKLVAVETWAERNQASAEQGVSPST